ncbi:hypothetical protein RS130_10090 [Paraglaciecola aquimarina]|uniref:Uncharacterized protein n=1 Tax=Paraglaciecola aquimarina TaxID=1235557 RepID=A0ABU3SW35_9ALTE|nr:hypothetical protein [Paraglaciecola aquimarina]MDU0354235.1 hypothetical protein [Paraglaciecola aquimarina]
MISKKIRELFVSMMEAYEDSTPVAYDADTEQYTGYLNQAVVNKFIDSGLLELIDNNVGLVTVLINDREDFLSGFASGVNEARLGRDQSYADYNANPFAFSVGYEQFLYMNKKPRLLAGYVCHGFINDETGDIHVQ